MSFVRSENPIWYMVDSLGNQLNDDFYIFFLTNEIPYIPQNVYQDPDGITPWASPLQFNANGTLPDNLYFDPALVYRIEVHEGPLISDPLAFNPIENYVPDGGGINPPDDSAIFTPNQITNPQFQNVSFDVPSGYTASGVTDPVIEIAPGWQLVAQGTGTFVVNQIPITGDEEAPTNPSYALSIASSGTFSAVYLRQRFNSNGALWAAEAVSVALTAKSNDGAASTVSADIVDSNGTSTNVLAPQTMLTTYQAFAQGQAIPTSTNPDSPDVAYTELRINLPIANSVTVTSVQLVGEDNAVPIPYAQETPERQTDHLFHYYANSLIMLPKDSILVGWDFALNPWQFANPAGGLLATANAAYVTDQTILFAQGGANAISYRRATAANNYGLEVIAATAANRFATIQYLDKASARSYWGNIMSSVVKSKLVSAGTVRIKARLIYRASSVPTLSSTNPISSWTGAGDPVFAAGWTGVAPANDPAYTLGSGINYTSFDGFQLPAASTDDMYLGIVIYTIDNMDDSDPDSLIYDKISLVPNEFGVETNPLTFNQTLSNCEFYYEKSYSPGTLPGTAGPGDGHLLLYQLGAPGVGANAAGFASGFGWIFRTVKRIRNPAITFYSTNSGTAGNVYGVVVNAGTGLTSADAAVATYWTQNGDGATGVTYAPASGIPFVQSASPSSTPTAFIEFQYTIDARLGV